MATIVSSNDVMVDLIMERAIDLLRLEAGTRNKVITLLHDLENDILASIAKIAPTDPLRLSARRIRLEKLLALVENSIRSTYRLNSQLLASEIREIADLEATWTGRAINASIQVEFATVGLTREALATLVSDVMIQGAPSKEWWGRQAQGLSDKFADEMRRGVALGETNAALVKRVRGTAEAPGLMQVSRVSAERLVRASVQTAANAGRSATYAANSDLIAAVMWHATLDTRTSIWCLARDGHKYGPVDHESLEGAPPWLEGPGAIHWNALVEGTVIKTGRGDIPIEQVAVGDSVLTHTGQWSTVTARRTKRHESGVVRVVHTQSGRVLRATDDHPVRLSNGAWKFVGALETGDDLLANSESVSEISLIDGVINSEAEDCPPVPDNTQIALKRTFKLVAPDIDFESDPDTGYREVEDRCVGMILRDPSIIERDQSAEHHFFAMAHVLKQVGCDRLGDLLSLLIEYRATGHQ